jgi:hypothetical protein
MKAVFAPRVLAAALLALATTFAQDSPSSVLHWTAGAPNATSEVKDGVTIEGLKTDTVHIYVSLSEIKETNYNRVWVQVSNHGTAPINFDPLSAVLLKGDKSVRAEAADKAAGSIQRLGEAKAQELASAKCPNMIATQCQPNNAELQQSKQIQAYTSQQGQWVRDNGLKAKTLAPGDEEQGAIPFRKDKKPADYTLRIAVGSQTFEFPLSAQNKAPAYDNQR